MKILIEINSEDELSMAYFASILAEIIVEQAKQTLVNDDLTDCSGSNCGHDWELSVLD